MVTLRREKPWSSLKGILRAIRSERKQLCAVLHFVSSSIRPQADLVQHALGADSP